MSLNPFKRDDEHVYCPECGAQLVLTYSVAFDPLKEAIWLDCPVRVSHYSKHVGYRDRDLKFDPITGDRFGN